MPKKTNDISPVDIKEIRKAIEAVVGSELGDFRNIVKTELTMLSDRIDEMGEQLNDGRKGEARLLLTEKLYKTDVDEILEVTRLSPLAIKPFACALALDAMMSPAVQSGRISLTRVLIDKECRLSLSARGWNRGITMPALVEQVGAGQVEEGHISELEAGGSR